MVKEFDGLNYWAVILGGSSGLGLATAHKLAQNGMNLCIVHRTRKADQIAVEAEFSQMQTNGILVRGYNLDATNAEKRNSVLAELTELLGESGKVRALIHSLAKGNLKPMLAENQPVLQHDDFQLTIDAMAISLYDWTKDLLSANLFATDARVISFTSEGSQRAWKNYAAVSAAKAALEAISRSMALELAPSGIRSNCILAGITDTASLRMIPGSDALLSHTQHRNPFARTTQATDIANVAYLLCTDEAAWINGTVIPVTGGEHLQ
ncbi:MULTISPECIES: SDR family oxidoreductase [unclassified Spirosoma]|uniref:SDR family oxidoreductase n=1 Tax=unclassified Spirosoma TaxID=2621999 RepID=UPI0009691059|nr:MULTISPECIES: SDR family oxidoreductase [unclassified Spirosoma]MBN8823050.1 SDR family oxidoreductase [Spirosoma sp.]OJW73149.1 MAG: short-chain dehydrogenase [Spirosoma sp. 48-14]